MVSNRFILGIVAFSVSFGLSLVPNGDFTKAFFTGLITVMAAYSAAFLVDSRRRNHEMLVLDSLHKRIKEIEGLKFRLVGEINQLEAHRNLLYTDSNNLQNQIVERRNHKDSLNRELSNFIEQKKHLQTEITKQQSELNKLDKTKAEQNNSFSVLTAEKRRLDLNCNLSRAELTQLQTQISSFKQEKLELESNLTLLNRLKPQLEEKLYELRIKLQDLEVQISEQNELFLKKQIEQQNIVVDLNLLKTELQQVQEQFLILQEERDLLQNQVWELLQQMEVLNQKPLDENSENEDEDLFPFSEFIETLEPTYKSDKENNLPEE